MRPRFGRFILSSPCRQPIPIGIYTGLELTGASVRQSVTDPRHQVDAVLAMHEKFHTTAMLTAMDLSAEAELFGCEIRMFEDEIPTVIGRKVQSEADIDNLKMPTPGDGRTAVHLGAAQRLVAQAGGVPVLGGVIGPFSLAGRLVGVSEALELTLSNPEMMHRLLTITAQFLTQYVLAFRALGVHGVIMAEPAAGLLSPRGLSQFSSAYIKGILAAALSDDFTIILHNCGAKLVHLPRILETGAEIFHFGAPMEIGEALRQVDREVILAGNLDPSSIFHNGTPELVAEQARLLMEKARGYKNFIPSSGCDLAPHTPVANLEAFYATVRGFAE